MAEPNEERRSFPLSALFILMAACAVVAALMAPLTRAMGEGKIGVADAAVASACGALMVMLLGAVIGLYHHRPARGLGWGIVTGGGIGMVMGPVVLSPLSAFPSLLTMSVGGAAALLVVSAMKMETLVTAPCAGVVAALLPLQVGDVVSAGQIVATLSPAALDTPC